MKELNVTMEAVEIMSRAFSYIRKKDSCNTKIGCDNCLLCGIARAAGIDYTANIGSLKNIGNILSKTKFYTNKYGVLYIINTDTGLEIERTEKRIDILFRKLFKCNI